MRATPKQLAAALVETTHDATTADAQEAVKSLVTELAKNGRAHLVRKVVRAMDAAWRARFGASRVVVTSAHPLSKADAAKLAALAPGADLETSVDASLIGGAVIRLDDRLFDGSVSGSLKRLSDSLIHGS